MLTGRILGVRRSLVWSNLETFTDLVPWLKKPARLHSTGGYFLRQVRRNVLFVTLSDLDKTLIVKKVADDECRVNLWHRAEFP